MAAITFKSKFNEIVFDGYYFVSLHRRSFC